MAQFASGAEGYQGLPRYTLLAPLQPRVADLSNAERGAAIFRYTTGSARPPKNWILAATRHFWVFIGAGIGFLLAMYFNRRAERRRS
jgi:hypothetical protein